MYENRLQDTIKRIKSIDFIIVYSCLIILGVILVIIVFFGSKNKWYEDLTKININPWYIKGLWIIGTIFSFIGFLLIWDRLKEDEIPRDLIISVLYIINGFLFIGWAVIYYYAENIKISLLVTLLLAVYNFIFFLFIWAIKPMAAIFLMPNLFLYVFLIYDVIKISTLNNMEFI